MAHIKDGPRSNRHVNFTAAEDAKVRKRAEKVGMEVVPFIKQQALNGKVQGFPLAPLTKHQEAIDEIVVAAKSVAAQPHKDRWLYEADLEAMDDKLSEVLEIERAIYELLRRRMK